MLKEKFVQLAKAYEAKKDELNLLKEELTNVMKELGLNQYAQDPETGAVYKIYKPEGTFVSFKEIDFKRTALTGERGGMVLSKKEAEEAGFILRK